MRISDWSSDVCSSDLSLAGNRSGRSDRGIVPRNPGFDVRLQFLARLHDFACKLRFASGLVDRFRRSRRTNHLGHDLRIGADANGVGAGFVGEVIALDRRVIGVGGCQAVSLPLDESGDRKSVVWGKSVSVRVDLGGRSCIKKKKKM